MSIWEKLKKRHWEGEYIPAEPPFVMGWYDRPPLRRAWDWLAKLWAEHPLGVISTGTGVVVGIATIIRLFR